MKFPKTVALLLLLAPAVLFFLWIGQSMSTPILNGWLGWPWLVLPWWCNVLTFGAFAAGHSLLAGRLRRIWYLVVTDLSVVVVMGFWAPSGSELWRLPVSVATGKTIALILTGIYLAIHCWIIRYLGFQNFLGIGNGSVVLCDRGPYRYIRHPQNLNLILFIALAPSMTIDRLLFLAMCGIYLLVAIPREEARLVRTVPGYAEYRQRTILLMKPPCPAKQR